VHNDTQHNAEICYALCQLCSFMLSVTYKPFMLNVVMLSVMAPKTLYETLCPYTCDHIIGGKITQFLKKWPKHTQSQKCQNTSIQANLESQKHLHQTTFET
jgi:hypothetical protein